MKKIISFVLGLTMTMSLGTGFLSGCMVKERAFDNIIVVIGDGMGENHILNALTYFDLDIPVFMEDQVGYIGTDSLSGTTDSAAGGTALATGKKVKNSNVAYYNGKNLTQITSIAKKAKMKTGVITTDTLDGATPAAFSAHAELRTYTRQIMETQAKSGIDLLIGRHSSDYANEIDLFTARNYTVAKAEDELYAAMDSKKLIGLIRNVDSEYSSGNELDFQLKDMARFAIDYLENKNGFFLMIEGAYIDKHSHNNDLVEALCEVRSLIDTISFLYEYASDGKTALFITADHETGGLNKAETKEDIAPYLYTSTSHTDTPVPIFVKNYEWNPQKFGYEAGVNPENTMVFDACKAIINGK